MPIKQVVIQFSNNLRLVLDPEGGSRVEAYADGIGWTVADASECPDEAWLYQELDDARDLLGSAMLTLRPDGAGPLPQQ
jgi:hypothetical protein